MRKNLIILSFSLLETGKSQHSTSGWLFLLLLIPGIIILLSLVFFYTRRKTGKLYCRVLKTTIPEEMKAAGCLCYLVKRKQLQIVLGVPNWKSSDCTKRSKEKTADFATHLEEKKCRLCHVYNKRKLHMVPRATNAEQYVKV